MRPMYENFEEVIIKGLLSRIKRVEKAIKENNSEEIEDHIKTMQNYFERAREEDNFPKNFYNTSSEKVYDKIQELFYIKDINTFSIFVLEQKLTKLKNFLNKLKV